LNIDDDLIEIFGFFYDIDINVIYFLGFKYLKFTMCGDEKILYLKKYNIIFQKVVNIKKPSYIVFRQNPVAYFIQGDKKNKLTKSPYFEVIV
jgi:hypothetical protein